MENKGATHGVPRVYFQIAFLLGCIITVMLLILFTPIGWQLRAVPPLSARQPLIYPGAAQLTSQIDGNVQIASFQSLDTPAEIASFYKSKLERDGWENQVVPLSLTPMPNSASSAETLYFYWRHGFDRAGYILHLKLERLQSSKTQVNIKFALDLVR
ncbi:MAG TPA: hypothetical protein VEX13_15500 [Chloroflexia bacterium]|nr:hypothetical protein [Chloroflexia bacterium]